MWVMTHTHLLAPVIWVDTWKKKSLWRRKAGWVRKALMQLQLSVRIRRQQRPAEACPGEDVQGDRTSV